MVSLRKRLSSLVADAGGLPEAEALDSSLHRRT